jgi:hypothetical protein
VTACVCVFVFLPIGCAFCFYGLSGSLLASSPFSVPPSKKNVPQSAVKARFWSEEKNETPLLPVFYSTEVRFQASSARAPRTSFFGQRRFAAAGGAATAARKRLPRSIGYDPVERTCKAQGCDGVGEHILPPAPPPAPSATPRLQLAEQVALDIGTCLESTS